MKVSKSHIPGLLIVEPSVFEDERGYFMESYNRNRFLKETGFEKEFVQDNESLSNKGVLRGLHFQIPPYAQDKLVRVIKGSVIDVAVDIRKDSPTYGKFEKVLLSEENKKQFLVPQGFAHGFLVLEDNTIFSYKCSRFYHRESEKTIRWNDPKIGIDWGIDSPVLSEKDRLAELSIDEFESPFIF